jgi:hypothetical protein
VALFLQNPQQCANGGITGRFREQLMDLRHRGLAARVQDVHDLPFTTAQWFFIHHGLIGCFANYAKKLALAADVSTK